MVAQGISAELLEWKGMEAMGKPARVKMPKSSSLATPRQGWRGFSALSGESVLAYEG